MPLCVNFVAHPFLVHPCFYRVAGTTVDQFRAIERTSHYWNIFVIKQRLSQYLFLISFNLIRDWYEIDTSLQW